MPATIEFGARHATKVADVLNVLADGEIRIETECLCQIACLCTGLPGVAAEDFGHAGRRFHHPGENLKGRRLPGAVRPDEPKNLSPRNRKRNAANSLERPVSLRQIGDSDRDIRGRRVTGGYSHGRDRHVDHRLLLGHVSPLTRISPSAGIPGFAKPTAPLS